MCDTLGTLQSGAALFAKNSDRSPNEIQLLEYHPPKTGLSGMVSCTYCAVPQVSETYGVLLSRPKWMWGAEMGVNQWGLCIGNEAVFTLGKYGKTGLTGMDMVRLALERCRTVHEALELLIRLLEEYGQGGNCGFDHKFYYDNAFLLMDRQQLIVLETAGKDWVYKKYTAVNISNRLSIGADGDGYSGGNACHFQKKHTEPVYTTFSGSNRRAHQIRQCLPQITDVRGCIDALSCHDHNANPFGRGSVSSACMHYGGLVGDHTTASMVVSLSGAMPLVFSTGCSLPCVSLFKPWLFGTDPVVPVTMENQGTGSQYWMEAEAFRRSLLGKVLPEEFYQQRDTLQNQWILTASQTDVSAFSDFSRQCLKEESDFYAYWKSQKLDSIVTSAGFRNRWQIKNRILFP